MSHYFLFSNNRVITPIGLEELKRKVRSGEVTEQHMISIDGGDWIAAREIQGLFPGAAVETKSSSTGSESLRPPPSPSLADWFYSKNGQTVGPMPEDAIRGLAKSGVIAASDFVWTSRQSGAATPAAHTPILADTFLNSPPEALLSNQQPLSDDSQLAYKDGATPKSTTSHKTQAEGQDRVRHRQDGYLPISNGGLSILSHVVLYAGGISFFAAPRFYPTKPELFEISILGIIVLSLLFFCLYVRALYRCWKLVHLFGDTRWPSPGWVLGIDIGCFLFCFTIDSPIATILKIISVVFTHIWLGIRIDNIFTRFDTVDEDSLSSKTTRRAIFLALWYIALGLRAFTYPTLSDMQFVRLGFMVIAVIVTASNRFIQSAVAGANRCMHLAAAPAAAGNLETL